jgi:hypothetical protein
MQIVFNNLQSPLSWLPNRPFSFWDILKHFRRSADVKEEIQLDATTTVY